MSGLRRAWLAAICVGLAVLGIAAPARAVAPEPEFSFGNEGSLPGGGSLDGPCGLAVDSFGRLYVADYYNHAIRVFDSSRNYLTQVTGVDPASGPCGLAVGGTGALYANVYHRSVLAFTPSSFPPGSTTFYSPAGPFAPPLAPSYPTGVAVDRLSGIVYVNYRTYVAAYEADGDPILDGGEPLKIGEGTLGDAHGLAVSAFPGSSSSPTPTAGFLYVPDAADDTVKVYDPATSTVNPVATIAGPPGNAFGSLRDSAVAVDRVTGETYVIDTLGPQSTHSPLARVYVFAADGTADPGGFRLKYDVVDGAPTGLAIDNSSSTKQGRVYVTDGNGAGARVVAYPRGSATSQGAPPLSLATAAGPSASNAITARGAAPSDGAKRPASTPSRGTPNSLIVQKGNLRVQVSGRIAPKRLPRRGKAPVSISVGGRISTTDGSLPPPLRAMRIEFNRNGSLDLEGLPACDYKAIQPGSSSRALAACRSALVGKGSFTANITVAGQEVYPTSGKLLVFNGRQDGRPVLFGHIYSTRPFATSFVIVFALKAVGRDPYGMVLDASLPVAMDAWGRLTGLQMTLRRDYSHRAKKRSFLSAGCPAPKGFPGAVFSLARTEFSFDGGRKLRLTLASQCKARGQGRHAL